MTIDKRFLLILMAAILAGSCSVALAQENGDNSATGGAVIGNGDDSSATDTFTDGASTDPDDPDGVGSKGKKNATPFDLRLLFIMVGFLGLMYFFSSRTRKKQQTQRREMLSKLSKGDKVTSIGGIVGTVVEVKDTEVVVRVDETNNIKMRFLTSAISRVGDDSVPDDAQKKK